MAQPRLRSRPQDRAAPPDRRAPRDRRRQRGRRRSRRSRARCARIRATRRRTRSSIASPASSTSGRDAAALYDDVASSAGEDDLKVALLFRRAQIQEHELRDDKGAVETYERDPARRRRRDGCEAATAIQTIHERTGRLAQARRYPQAQERDPADVDERKQLLYRAAQIEEEVLGNADAAIATFRQVLSIDDVDMRRDGRPRADVRPARALGAAQGRLREEGRPRRGSGRQEADALRARAGLRPRARRRRARRSRPTRASSISTRTSCPRSSRSTGSTARPSAGTTCSATSSARSSSPRQHRRDRRAQVPDRSPLAAPARRHRARDRELSRGARPRSVARRDAPRARRPRARQDRAGHGGARARADLRRLPASTRSSSTCSR